MTRPEMINAVKKLTAVDGSEADMEATIYKLKTALPHSKISDIIFYPDKERTEEEIVDEAIRREKLFLAS